MGDSVLNTSPRPFHSIRPDATTDAKLSICRRSCHGVSTTVTGRAGDGRGESPVCGVS